ncbi:hypothetical protein DXV76_13960 [Rhodobacteraceae bacterium CCMM004]|nr:hypothetical protein DXV76_13960 [Rhodobacteraceae bacterium CCMM004]
MDKSDGRRPQSVQLSDLPAPVRLAYPERELATAAISAGAYDDAAHGRLAEAPASMRAEAERRAAVVRAVTAAGAGRRWPDRLALAGKAGGKRISKDTLKRYLTAAEGVDAINWAPALLPRYRPTAPYADMSPEAWTLFLSILRKAGKDFALVSAWRDVRDLASGNGWAWPSRPTVVRRWQALSQGERPTIREGRDAAVKALAQPAMRRKHLVPLSVVSLDGRMLDVWADWGDGRAVRPITLALVDVASNTVLDFLLCRSENAADTVRLICRTVERYGIFDTLYTDNGSGFSGHLVAGGNVQLFRRRGAKAEGVKPIGVCHHLGITIRHALPRGRAGEDRGADLRRAVAGGGRQAGVHRGPCRPRARRQPGRHGAASPDRHGGSGPAP